MSLVESDARKHVGDTIVIRDGLEMPIPPRVFDAPPMHRAVEASFGGDLSLLGYDLEQESDELQVKLHWRARRRMQESYKFFVHFYAVDGDEPVAQADVVPRDWTYPTSWWEAEEVVSDEVYLPLGDVSSGEYRLAVGVYHPGTGERLAVSTETLTVLSDALILQSVIIP
jgi:hypothetical protein